MNERILELKAKCIVQERKGTSAFDSYVIDRFDTEKFAELIVRECAEVCMKEIDTGWVMAPKSPWMAKQILEHFGIDDEIQSKTT